MSGATPVITPFREILTRKPPPPLLAGLLPVGGLAVLFGPPGAGKTFSVLDLALSIVTDREKWAGRDLHSGTVVFIAGEGASGLRSRALAWNGGPPGADSPICERLLVVDEAVRFLDDEHFAGFLDALRELPEQPVLIVVDTLARALVRGDENSTRDMGKLVARCDELRRETGAAVLLVHHTGKDENSGARGSSALVGAADVTVRAAKQNSRITLAVSKQPKEMPPVTDDMAFELQQVTVELDGQQVASARLIHLGGESGTLHSSQDDSPLSHRVLDLLAAHDGLSPQEMMKDLGVGTTLYKALNSLERKGLAKRGAKKGRHDTWFITELGQAEIDGAEDLVIYPHSP